MTVDNFSAWFHSELVNGELGPICEAVALICDRYGLDTIEAVKAFDWNKINVVSLNRVDFLRWDYEEGYLEPYDLLDFVDWERAEATREELEDDYEDDPRQAIRNAIDWEKAADALAGNCVDLKRFDWSVEDWHRPARASR